MQKADRVIHFKTYQDEIVKSKNQNYKVSENYTWLHEDFFSRLWVPPAYVLCCVIGYIYCRFGLNIKLKNRHLLNQYKEQGYFLYGNHTQPLGDVFLPALICQPKRIFVIASQANIGIPIIGKILPALGAVTIPETISQMEKFLRAIEKHIEKKHCIVVYPEAHVWPYYTKIRPFPATSFRFPVKTNAPVFSMTLTYQLRKKGKKPSAIAYIDGPFFPDQRLEKKHSQEKLRNEIYAVMQERSRCNTYEYIYYMKEDA